MKRKSLFTYILLVLFILLGMDLSAITTITPISMFFIHFGHGLLIVGIFIILGKFLSIFRKRKTISSIELLLSQDLVNSSSLHGL